MRSVISYLHREALKDVVKAVNNIKWSAKTSHCFKNLCKGLGSGHLQLYYSEVHWLSRGKVLSLFNNEIWLAKVADLADVCCNPSKNSLVNPHKIVTRQIKHSNKPQKQSNKPAMRFQNIFSQLLSTVQKRTSVCLLIPVQSILEKSVPVFHNTTVQSSTCAITKQQLKTPLRFFSANSNTK